jgi:transcriptional antiterminator RfaH
LSDVSGSVTATHALTALDEVRRWFVARTHPRREAQACTVLEQRGVESYSPCIVPRRADGRRDRPVEPLFPGYIFCRLAPGSPEWVAARCAPGVAYFLGVGGVPSPLPDELIADIRRRLIPPTECPSFAPQERVTIDGGPFAGYTGVFDGMLSASGRARVLLEVVDRRIRLDLDVATLRRAG